MKTVGVILAGGRSDSYLTKERAAAALPIAGYYSAIDFSLSSMVNSGIKKVAVVTQYSSRSLNEHLKSASWWGFGRKHGGLFLISPMVTADRQEWYHGTIDALSDTIDFLRESHEPYAAIASGDGVYTIDYEKILEEHIKNDAEITVVCKSHSGKNTGRFGVVKIDEENRIEKFTEKSRFALGELISCGIYLLRRRLLIELLEKAVEQKKADFVREILVPEVAKGRVFSYIHEGYWKNVSADKSYYHCNMDFLKPEVQKEFFTGEDTVLTRIIDRPPAKYLSKADVSNSLIGSGVVINGSVSGSVLFGGAVVEEGAKVTDSILFPNVVVKAGEKIKNKIVTGDEQIPV